VTGFLESRGVKPQDGKAEMYDELLEMAREARREERRREREAAKAVG
jgi:hypothetical protein